MRTAWGIHWNVFVIFFIFCVTPATFSQQSNPESSVFKYTETIDLRELSDNIKNLTTNVGQLTESQKQLTESVKNLTTSMNGFNVRISVIEERTVWFRTIQNIILVAIVGGIIMPIILHILSSRNKNNQLEPELIPDQVVNDDKGADKQSYDLQFGKGTT